MVENKVARFYGPWCIFVCCYYAVDCFHQVVNNTMTTMATALGSDGMEILMTGFRGLHTTFVVTSRRYLGANC